MRIKNLKQNIQIISGANKVRKKSKIDMHVHYLPDIYKEALLKSGEKKPDGFPTPEWSVESHIRIMKHLGITTSMISISSPHVYMGSVDAAKILARKANEEGAKIVATYPDSFGLLASLPLPSVEDTLKEIAYALDVLNADGFTLPTNAGGIYLGSSSLDPVFEELNKRNAVVTIHPNKPSNISSNVNEDLPIPIMEFLFDTTRTVTNMMIKGTFKRFPNIKFIIPHAGAFLTILADRLDPFLQHMPLGDERLKLDVYSTLKGLYYDLAGFCLPRQLENLLEIVDSSHLLYGSDSPYTPEFGCIALAALLDMTDLLTESQRNGIYYKNAVALFPRLRP